MGNTPFAVDSISAVEATSDSIQSHVSQVRSSKRNRTYASTAVGKSEELSDLTSPLEIIVNHGHYHTQGFWALYLLGESSHIPHSLRTTRRGHIWTSMSIVHRACILYCLLSCVIASAHLFTNIVNPAMRHAWKTRTFEIAGNLPASMVVTQYLTRSLVVSTPLEPFVINILDETASNITICAWLPDVKLHLFGKWRQSWPGFVSLLVTTNHRASSSSHQRLLKTLRQMASKPWMKGVSIHLLHIKEHAVGSPNLYLNLARLFASTDWVLIMPGEPEGYIPPKVSDIMSPAPHPSEYVLVSGNHSYPFPDLSPLLIHKTNDFWCSELVLATDSRTKDWSECLWQLNLETAGTLKTLNMSLTVPTPKEDERGSISEKLIGKYRDELCNSVIYRMSMTRAGKQRVLDLEWAKSYCRKSVNRKREV